MDNVEVSMHGPVFNGQALAAMRDFERAAVADVADYGVEAVRENLHGVLKHPTGRYSSTIHAQKAALNAEILDGTVYGPWLEGVGSRNATTRFKGYHTFRKTTQKVQEQAGEIAAHALPPYLARMNG
jgi:hypothetical protein